MNNDYFKKIMTTVILAVLAVLAFFVLKPILLSVIMGVILVVVFVPLYERTLKYIPYKTLASGIICTGFAFLIILPFLFLTPIFVTQSFDLYLASQQIDIVQAMKDVLPSTLASDEFTSEVGSILNSFISKAANSFTNILSQFILNFPQIFLQLVVVFATFFFLLRDYEKVTDYIKSLMPFSKDVENKLFTASKEITISVIYGQVVLGVIQGLVVGTGFFIFGVSNSLLLTLFAVLAGIFPIIGTTIVWVPVAIFLLIGDSIMPAVGVSVFGLVAVSLDNIIRPAIVSKRTRIHPLLVLLGMIGGLFLFGILGIILGPLILAYVLIVLEIYRGKEVEGIFIKNP